MPSEVGLHCREGRGSAVADPGGAGCELVRVVLVSGTPNSFSHLVRHLETRDCGCRLVTTYGEALRLLCREGCDLLIGVAPLPHGTVSSLASPLADSHASFFCAQPVEDGCWWLPIYRRGKRCFAAPALRASEFAKLLDEIVEEVRHVSAVA
jgi:hypothetical protein